MQTVKVNDKEYRIEFDRNTTSSGTINGDNFEIDKIKTGKDAFHVLKDHKSYSIEILKTDELTKEVTIKVNNNIYDLKVYDELDLLLEKLGMNTIESSKVNNIKAPMPGLVLDVCVEVGQEVKKGDKIMVLEAMKMENNLKAPTDCIVKEIKCETGNAVEKNEVLIIFE